MNKSKIALITGANRGIGLETAKQLGQQDVTVILGARNLESGKAAAQTLRDMNIDAYAIELDITKPEERRAVVNFIADKFGRLDILINNAGVAPKDWLAHPIIIETSPEDFETVFQANFFSTVYLTNDLLPLLKKSKAARIVNLSSIVASLTLQSMEDRPLAGFSSLAYNSSKAALNMFTILLSEELKNTSIKVNSVHPGWVKTAMGSENATMEVSEGAKASVHLALIDDDGPTGKFMHLENTIPW